jgi:hypothetical protein
MVLRIYAMWIDDTLSETKITEFATKTDSLTN